MTTTAGQLGMEPLEVDKRGEDDLELFSVTTCIGALDKPALLYWAAAETAEAAIENQSTWKAMLEDRGHDETVKWLRDARFRKPKTKLSSDNLGVVVHKVCEEYGLNGVRPSKDFVTELVIAHGSKQIDLDAEVNLVGRMLMQFENWCQRFTPTYAATEVAVYHQKYGYAGQLDAIMSIDGVRFVADYKSRREGLTAKGEVQTPYPEQTALQLAAYRHAEFAAWWRPRRYTSQFKRRYYLLSPEERAKAVPVPEVDTGLCILITPQSCEAYPMRCDEDVFMSFLYVLESFRWVNDTCKTVMGQPLQEQ